MSFLLLLFIIFIIIPLAQVLWKLYLLRRKVRRTFRDFSRAYGGGRGEARNSAPEPPVKKKKIEANVGEYVSFEEIEATVTQTDTEVKYTVEEQVVDVEWEDIPADEKK